MAAVSLATPSAFAPKSRTLVPAQAKEMVSRAAAIVRRMLTILIVRRALPLPVSETVAEAAIAIGIPAAIEVPPIVAEALFIAGLLPIAGDPGTMSADIRPIAIYPG